LVYINTFWENTSFYQALRYWNAYC